MAEVNISGVVEAPVEEVWKSVRALDKIPEFLPIISEAKVEGDGVGATRTCTTAEGGQTFRANIEVCDDETRIVEYSIIDEGSPFPMRGYRGHMHVMDRGDGTSQFTWKGTYEPAEGAEPFEVLTMMNGVYEMGLKGLQEKHAPAAPQDA